MCGACGESRAHAIRGVPSIFSMVAEPSRPRHVSSGGHPRRLPLVGEAHQIDPDALPACVCREVYIESERRAGKIAGQKQQHHAQKAQDSDLSQSSGDKRRKFSEVIWSGVTDRHLPNFPSQQALDQYISLFPSNQALALSTLVKHAYNLPAAVSATQKSLNRVQDKGNGENKDGDDEEVIQPSWTETPIEARRLKYMYRKLDMKHYDAAPKLQVVESANVAETDSDGVPAAASISQLQTTSLRIFCSDEVDCFADAIAEFGNDAFGQVTAYMCSHNYPHTTIREVQDFYYGQWSCGAELKARALTCNNIFEARMRALVQQERKQKMEQQAALKKIESERRREERLKELSEFGGGSCNGSGSGISSVTDTGNGTGTGTGTLSTADD